MNIDDIFSSFPSGISAERTLSVQCNSSNWLLFSFLQVPIFRGHLFCDYFANQVASTKILVAMAPKVVAAWRVEMRTNVSILANIRNISPLSKTKVIQNTRTSPWSILEIPLLPNKQNACQWLACIVTYYSPFSLRRMPLILTITVVPRTAQIAGSVFLRYYQFRSK